MHCSRHTSDDCCCLDNSALGQPSILTYASMYKACCTYSPARTSIRTVHHSTLRPKLQSLYMQMSLPVVRMLEGWHNGMNNIDAPAAVSQVACRLSLLINKESYTERILCSEYGPRPIANGRNLGLKSALRENLSS